MNKDEHKLSHTVKTSNTQVKDVVVGIIVERVAVGIVRQLLIGWNLLCKEERDWLMLAVCSDKVDDKASELVDNECASW